MFFRRYLKQSYVCLQYDVNDLVTIAKVIEIVIIYLKSMTWEVVAESYEQRGSCSENPRLNKLTSVCHNICPVIDHEFRHNIVKVAVDPRGQSRVDP